jgi:formate-dependent nitrite reductase cytochrome c552 subunit
MMKKPMFRGFVSMVGVAALISCLPLTASADGPGVTQKYKQATAPFDDTGIATTAALPAGTVRVRRRYQGGRFWTETRKDKIERFKCSQCHNNKPVTVADAAQTAHGAIVLNHGDGEKQLSCYTCHNREDRNLLTTESGETVDMDHSYAVCGQCHFRQEKDWVGGAHGKRIGYWTGKRVVKPCTACHNPHAPRFEKRWPVTYSSPTAK